MTTIIEVLSQEHRLVESLFQKFSETQQPEIALKICNELTMHAELEEQVVYPEVGAEISQQMEDHATEEHTKAKDLISQIQQCSIQDTSKMTDLVKQLEKAISHHVEEEESEMFEAMKTAIAESELNRLAEEFIQGKNELIAAGGLIDLDEAEQRLDKSQNVTS